MMTPEQCAAARAVISAKVAFWEALGELERVTVIGEEWPGPVHDAVLDAIEDFAVGCGDTVNDDLVPDNDISEVFEPIFERQTK
jgi:hypothetical protein